MYYHIITCMKTFFYMDGASYIFLNFFFSFSSLVNAWLAACVVSPADLWPMTLLCAPSTHGRLYKQIMIKFQTNQQRPLFVTWSGRILNRRQVGQLCRTVWCWPRKDPETHRMTCYWYCHIYLPPCFACGHRELAHIQLKSLKLRNIRRKTHLKQF